MMDTQATHPAGAIGITLHTRGDRVAAVRLASTRRTDFSRRLFAGRSADQLLGTLPLVFSVCATAQTSAAVQAVERAAGYVADPVQARARELLVLVETAREHLFRILLGWSAWLGIPPAPTGLGEIGRMRAAWGAALFPQGDAFRPGGGRLAPDRDVLGSLFGDLDDLVTLALGVDRAHWLTIADTHALHAWSLSSGAVAPHMLRRVADDGLEHLGAGDIAPLPDMPDEDLRHLLAGDAGDAFVAKPVWGGMPRETGALQRQADWPLVAAHLHAFGNGLLSRQVARLTEVAVTVMRIEVLLGAVGEALPDVRPFSPDGIGIAQVEAARGRLVHRVEFTDGLVSDYRILAPTEWNFHPDGTLARGLLGLPAGPGLTRLAQLLVDAVDPCVESRIVVRDDA